MLNDANIRDAPCNEDSCNSKAFQDIDVCVPIIVDPRVDLGEAVIDCIEDPCFIPIPCRGWNEKKGKCRFTICQKLRIMIPIEFSVDACNGPVSVKCSEEEGEGDDNKNPPFICCEEEGQDYNKNDFYYFVKGRIGRLKR